VRPRALHSWTDLDLRPGNLHPPPVRRVKRRALIDDVSNLDFTPGANFDALKAAMLTYIDSRRLAVELTAEAVRKHSADKQAWATKVLQSSNAQAQIASALLNKVL
jgi:hypothetical protein